MIRRPPRSTQSRSSAASDVYKRQDVTRFVAVVVVVFFKEVNVANNQRQRLLVAQHPLPFRVHALVVGAAVGDARQPVSYTHLRAHETVLDLVCRLLLEKKKKK